MSRTLVIVPGSFVASEAYDPVVEPLRAKGYTIHVLDPPSYPKGYAKGKVPPSMHDDADYISDFITKLDGDDVVLMAHSYGGTYCHPTMDRECEGLTCEHQVFQQVNVSRQPTIQHALCAATKAA
jgi:alpha-beta hydrolase superfamily lysophospholipase